MHTADPNDMERAPYVTHHQAMKRRFRCNAFLQASIWEAHCQSAEALTEVLQIC